MAEANVCSTPYSTASLFADSPLCSSHDVSAFRSMVGALHYLTFTRHHISFAVSKVCQFMHTPTYLLLTAVKHIFRYLLGSLSLGLHFRPGPLLLTAFQILIGLEIRVIGILQQVLLCFLVLIRFRGLLKSSLLYIAALRRLNIKL